MYCKLPSNRNIFLLYNCLWWSVHGGDHYSAIVQDNASPKESTNIGNKAPNENDANPKNTNEWEVDESQSSGNGVGDLRVNISDLHDMFSDKFCCDDGEYFDEFGDVVEDSGHDHHDGALVLNADVEMEQISTENEGNPIDITHEIAQTNTSDLNSITSTNAQNVDTNVEIVSDLAGLEDGLEIPESYHHEKRPRKLKYKKKLINYMKFMQMDSVLVDEIPWDVNRDQKYWIECDEEDYIDKSKDGCWFEMHTSSRKGLVGKRKAGVCQASLMCENPNCLKLLSEGIPNTNEFTKDSNVDFCKCCGYFVYHAYCSAIKVIEYDHETNTMQILYQGEHNCRLKPNRRKKFDEIRDLTKNDTSI